MRDKREKRNNESANHEKRIETTHAFFIGANRSEVQPMFITRNKINLLLSLQLERLYN